jgi:mycothiol synthase
METFCQRQREPWFDPEGFRIHERDGRMAAFCWTKVHRGEGGDAAEGGDGEGGGPIGEIYVIAVDPEFHGLGLGRQLTLAGLEHLAEEGITTAMLYVDAANEVGVQMYESLGFRIHSTNAAFVAEIAPRAEPAPMRIGPC